MKNFVMLGFFYFGYLIRFDSSFCGREKSYIATIIAVNNMLTCIVLCHIYYMWILAAHVTVSY